MPVLLLLFQGGKMGIALNIEYLEPQTEGPVDVAAAKTGIEGALGWFADPLFFGKLVLVLGDCQIGIVGVCTQRAAETT
jgi:beta-glucosidase/6-phospho-beta-glucosidase/beta-galactosidase